MLRRPKQHERGGGGWIRGMLRLSSDLRHSGGRFNNHATGEGTAVGGVEDKAVGVEAVMIASGVPQVFRTHMSSSCAAHRSHSRCLALDLVPVIECGESVCALRACNVVGSKLLNRYISRASYTCSGEPAVHLETSLGRPLRTRCSQMRLDLPSHQSSRVEADHARSQPLQAPHVLHRHAPFTGPPNANFQIAPNTQTW
jgi:hypothetical protein